MPRVPSEKVVEAEKLFQKGIAMVDIAKKLEVSDGTVRSWKNRYGWCNVAKKDVKGNATLQKKKRGGQPGNKNAKGGSGNPNPKPPPDMTKHGAYSNVYWDVLDEEEQILVDEIPQDEEALLIEQIQLFSVRERRIMQAINKYRRSPEPVAICGIIRTESKRAFKDEAEEEFYNQLIAEQVTAQKRLPGKGYDLQTTTDNKDQIIARLESELSNVQAKKTRAIEALSRIHLEKAKLDGANKGNDVVKSWTEKVLRMREKQSDG